MNVRRLRRIKKYILDEPLRVNMRILIRKKVLYCDLPYEHRKQWPKCGTVACISGWEISLYGDPIHDSPFESKDRLELPNHRLFHVSNWPDELRDKIAHLTSGTVKYANIVAEAIESYISTNGWQDVPC